MVNSAARPEDFGNAEQWVCHHLRRWILEGVLKADEEINQQELANRLGVSRSPVRDAIRRLEGMGLVTINPNQRAVVTSFTLDNMRELFEMRAALEGLAAHHAATQLRPSDLIELHSLADIMLRLAEVDAYLDKHEAFHDRVADRAGMPRLRRELARLREMATPYIRIYGFGRDSAELVGESHDALVEVLALRDPEAAAAAFAAHTRSAYEQLAAEVLKLTRDQEGPPETVSTPRGSRRIRSATPSSAEPAKRRRSNAGAQPAIQARTRRGLWRRLQNNRVDRRRREDPAE